MKTSHPRELYFLCLMQTCERFSYHGVQSLLILFLVKFYGLLDQEAFALFGVYATLTFISPVLGGFVADKWLGLSLSIILGNILTFIGCTALYFQNSIADAYIGLGFIVAGSGLFKPNLSALIGELYEKKDIRRESAYTIFFIFQNIGSFVAPLTCGSLGLMVGWRYGFGLAAFGSFMGVMVAFLLARKDFSVESMIGNRIKVRILASLAYLLTFVIFSIFIENFEKTRVLLLVVSLAISSYVTFFYMKSTRNVREKLEVIIISILAVTLSGALINHGVSSLSLFIDRLVNKNIYGFQIPATAFQAVDPITIAFAGLVAAKLWVYLKGRGIHVRPLTKYIIGFGCILTSYVLFSLISYSFDIKPGISLYQVTAVLALLASADIFIFPVALSQCSEVSPENLKGTVMGGVFLGMACSQLLSSYMAEIAAIPPDLCKNFLPELAVGYYQQFFVSMVVISFVSILLVILLRRRENTNAYI